MAVYVLIGHVRWLLWGGHAKWFESNPSIWEYPLAYLSAAFRFGNDAVMVFFVLSGFFIHFPWASRDCESRAFSITEFGRRRIRRLLPPYLLALLLTVILDLIGTNLFPKLYQAKTGDILVDSNFAMTGFSVEGIGAALLLLPSSLGWHFGTNTPLWSLAFEVIYYAAYPVWLIVRRRSTVLAYIGVPLASVLLSIVLSGGFVSSVLLFYSTWIAGAAIAERKLWQRIRSIPGYFGLLMTAGGISIAYLTEASALVALSHIFIGCGLVFAGVLTRPASIGSVLLEPLQWLGIRSYSIYIHHFPIVALFSAWAFFVLGSRPISGWFAVTGIIVAIAWSCIWFEVCERRFLNRRI